MLSSLVGFMQAPREVDARPWHVISPTGEPRSMVLLLTGQVGPFAMVDYQALKYTEEEALVAVFLARVYSMARNPNHKGILASKPYDESWNMLCARVRAAKAESADWAAWWLRMLKALRLDPEQVPQEYALVWEASYPALKKLSVLRHQPSFWNRVQMAADLVAREPGWRRQYFDFLTPDKEDS